MGFALGQGGLGPLAGLDLAAQSGVDPAQFGFILGDSFDGGFQLRGHVVEGLGEFTQKIQALAEIAGCDHLRLPGHVPQIGLRVLSTPAM